MIFELKLDGFRSLAYVEAGRWQLVSRRNHAYKAFDPLCSVLAEALGGHTAVLDGEIVVLDEEGRPQFYDLLRRRGTPEFYAFDVLMLEGIDLRRRPLIERKESLRGLIPQNADCMRYVPAFDEGRSLFKLTCAMDLEGIVCKRRHSLYNAERKPVDWIKIKNPTYSQAEGRAELFEKRYASV